MATLHFTAGSRVVVLSRRTQVPGIHHNDRVAYSPWYVNIFIALVWLCTVPTTLETALRITPARPAQPRIPGVGQRPECQGTRPQTVGRGVVGSTSAWS